MLPRVPRIPPLSIHLPRILPDAIIQCRVCENIQPRLVIHMFLWYLELKKHVDLRDKLQKGGRFLVLIVRRFTSYPAP